MADLPDVLDAFCLRTTEAYTGGWTRLGGTHAPVVEAWKVMKPLRCSRVELSQTIYVWNSDE